VSFLIPDGGETLASLVTLQEKQDVPMNSIANWELEMDTYRQTALRRRADPENKRQQRLAQGWEVARKAAGLLRCRFAVQRVAVFGSLIHPERFHTRSDVDLTAWGLNERDYLRAVAAVTGLDKEISVDLIAVEEAPESLRDLIRAEGSSL
jgi:predicted nucleotidyltransferase